MNWTRKAERESRPDVQQVSFLLSRGGPQRTTRRIAPTLLTVLRTRPPPRMQQGGDHPEVEQLDVVAAVVLLALLVAAQVGRQVFLVVVAEHGGDTGAAALLVGDLERAEQVRAGADADGDAELVGEPLRHDDGVAIPDVEDAAQRA